MRHEFIRTGDPIHPAWCDCSDCTLDRRRGLRLDFLAISLGFAVGLIVVAVLLARAAH